MSEDVLQREALRHQQAAEIVTQLELMERWRDVGEPQLVGAAAYGLLVAPDIDMEIYCREPDVEAGFSVIGSVAAHPGVWQVRFSNELEGPDQGLYWQICYRTGTDETWKVDMWLLADDHPGPRSADLAQPMRLALTAETRATILTIKEALQGREGVHSIDIYRAVLDEEVRTEADFLAWHDENRSSGLTFWRPKARLSDL